MRAWCLAMLLLAACQRPETAPESVALTPQPATPASPAPPAPVDPPLPELREARIPAKAHQYRRLVHGEVRRQWGMRLPDDAIPVGAATIHQESAWNPLARSAYAAGLTQFTPATFEDMKRLDPSIKDLGTVYNPAAAIRAMAAYHRKLWDAVPPAADDGVRWQFILSSYNGGLGWVQRDRRLCVSPCNPARWFGNVEMQSPRGPSAFRENREYVDKVWNRWRVVYRQF